MTRSEISVCRNHTDRHEILCSFKECHDVTRDVFNHDMTLFDTHITVTPNSGVLTDSAQLNYSITVVSSNDVLRRNCIWYFRIRCNSIKLNTTIYSTTFFRHLTAGIFERIKRFRILSLR